MALIEEAIWEKVTGDAAVVALLGKRFYPDQAPQDAHYPFAVYTMASERKLRTLSGYVSLKPCSVRIDVVAQTARVARLCLQAIDNAIDGFSGDLKGGQITVSGVFHEDQESGAEVPIHGNDLGEYTGGIDYTVNYNQN